MFIKKLVYILLLLSLAGPAWAKHHHRRHNTGVSGQKNVLMHKLQNTINNVPRSPIIKLVNQPQNVLCSALTIYKEARGLSEHEQSLVAKTVIHREETSNKTACQVVAEPGQFPWVKKLNKKWRPTEKEAWFTAQKVAILARYTNFYPEPSCYIQFFSVGLFTRHRRNLQCAIHLRGHYYYALKSL